VVKSGSTRRSSTLFADCCSADMLGKVLKCVEIKKLLELVACLEYLDS
jgi:hypothetical protein